jgi:hypothetical protein
MRPTKYELLQDGDRVILRAHSPDALQGFWNVEVVRRGVGQSLQGLRKHAEHLAKSWGVPLEDRLGSCK